ncbi:hypothetical protein B9Z19DRAFT_1067875 [Tuber borchii]|uniref:Uncharacterized protein n=1 Tax=Tuber borchii TaxID=42251 RepID=A0A2T6ZH97_TUBBO|nr:hypothetical protein B9Z19DRAFT_1067875 [Tuber borchii]
MNNITHELSSAPVGAGTATTEINKIQNLAPVTIADQLDQITKHIAQINKDMIQIHDDIARSCVDLPYRIYLENGAESFGIDNKPIPDFPEKIADIGALDAAHTDSLLRALGLPQNGTLVEKKERFGYHIGIARIYLYLLY